MLFEQAYICCNNPKMQGCLLLLENIKKKNLEEKKRNRVSKTFFIFVFNTLIVFNADSMKRIYYCIASFWVPFHYLPVQAMPKTKND